MCQVVKLKFKASLIIFIQSLAWFTLKRLSLVCIIIAFLLCWDVTYPRYPYLLLSVPSPIVPITMIKRIDIHPELIRFEVCSIFVFFYCVHRSARIYPSLVLLIPFLRFGASIVLDSVWICPCSCQVRFDDFINSRMYVFFPFPYLLVLWYFFLTPLRQLHQSKTAITPWSAWFRIWIFIDNRKNKIIRISQNWPQLFPFAIAQFLKMGVSASRWFIFHASYCPEESLTIHII